MHLADADDTDLNRGDHDIMIIIPLTPPKAAELQEVTVQDPSMQQLMSYIKNGWPTFIKAVPPELQKFYSFCNELTMANGLILRGDRLVVPQACQANYTEQLHRGHLGVDACKCHAQDTLRLPSVYSDIETHI